MILKLSLLLVVCFFYANCQLSESDSRCSSQPNFNCNCGPSGSQPEVTSDDSRSNIKQGRPGKIGPRGLVGSKGQKGERGRPDDTAEELQNIQRETQNQLRQIQQLKNYTDEELAALKKTVQDQKRQIDVLQNLVPSPSCGEIATRSNRTSGYYTLLLNQFVFRVYCNFTENSTETIVYHNTSSEVRAASCEPAKCSKHKIGYYVSLPVIIALIDQSSECRQFIKYRCDGSVIFYNENPTYAAWLSRDGSPQMYWGGATSRRERYCACGETNSCIDRSWKCNCDKNNSPETSDEGYLTDKDKLPVTEMQFGDNGDAGEKGWFTLGPLICSRPRQ